MRVTEVRMVELVTKALERARDRAAETGNVVSTGVRADVPSVDPTAWQDGMRAKVRTALSEHHGSTIGRTKDALAGQEGALETLMQAFIRAHEIALGAANGSMNAQDRGTSAREAQALHGTALVAGNTRGPNGEYLFSGSLGQSQAYDSTGAYNGDAQTEQVEVGEMGQLAPGLLNGTALRDVNGVNVMGLIGQLATDLSTNNLASISASLSRFNDAIDALARARTQVGARMSAFDSADEARRSLQLHLQETYSKTISADPVAAASDLAQAKNALEASQAVAQQIVTITRPQA